MPENITLSAGISLGLLAGIVSGVCYLFANGLSGRERRRCIAQTPQKHEVDICRSCGGDLRGGSVSCICYPYSPTKFEKGAWFINQIQRTLSLMPWSISSEKLEQIAEERDDLDSDGDISDSSARGELRNVRHFLETLSARLAGGPLDKTRVGPLYDHPAYLPQPRDGAISAGSAASGSSTASSAHAQLKRLVARVVEEAAALPALARYAAEPTQPAVDSTYEDLLATAILNKVIERYQNENGSGGRSSGIHSASASPTPSERSTPRSNRPNSGRERPRDFVSPLRDDDDEVGSDWEDGDVTDDALELPRRVPFPEFGGDIIHATENEEREFDEVSSSDIQAVDGSWEENWLFQKKKIKTLQSVPVPMLVPNSNTDYRALIGDRDADDTTDLSDNASDAEELEFKSDTKRVLDSKHVIGGKLKLDEEMEPDSLTSVDGVMEFDSLDGTTIDEDFKLNTIGEEANDILVVGIDSGPLSKAEFSVDTIHRTSPNDSFIVEKNYNGTHGDNIKPVLQKKESTNTLNGHEREGEYEETVAVPVQRYADSLRRKHFDEEQLIPTRDTDDFDSELIPGSIADRERRKWLNYVEMPNNPYSPEAIQKRLSAKSTSSIFDTLTKSSDFDQNESTVDAKDDFHISTKLIDEETIHSNGNDGKSSGPASPAPRVLMDVLAEEVPQFKRYDRDYYIREARRSTGGKKRSNYSDTSSVYSMHKAYSLDDFDRELQSPVSASSSVSELEAAALHHNLVRSVLSPRNASPNFAINPIYENDRLTERDLERGTANVRDVPAHSGDGYVENDDIVRLKIPNKPEITEERLERYTALRRSNTLRSEDRDVRSARRSNLNYTFGGSLRLSKPFPNDLW